MEISKILHSFWGILERMVGGKGSIYTAGTINGKFYGLVINETCELTSIAGGDGSLQSFVGVSLAPGTLITVPSGNPITQVVVASGSLIAYK